jgi:predicted transcriptional regulator
MPLDSFVEVSKGARRNEKQHIIKVAVTQELQGENLRRSQSEMIYAILEILQKQHSMKLTHIMYRVNINCLSLRDLLKMLQLQGYVKVESRVLHPLSKNKPCTSKNSQRSEYTLTAQGLEFYKTVRSTMKALNTLAETYDRERQIVKT